MRLIKVKVRLINGMRAVVLGLDVYDAGTWAHKYRVLPFGNSPKGTFLVTTSGPFADLNDDGVEDVIVQRLRGPSQSRFTTFTSLDDTTTVTNRIIRLSGRGIAQFPSVSFTRVFSGSDGILIRTRVIKA